ncbi:MAG: histidine kinase, partial [Chitinophagaceae bacterium]|nr:histidine kinase [Chitinophagaceae bacterium]
MSYLSKIYKAVTKLELVLFVAFYSISSILYYTATWITWGGLENNNLSFFNIEEFFAAAGVDFIISLFITLPIWFVTVILFNSYSYKLKFALHIFFLPFYLLACYYLQSLVKDYFGWAMFWGGKKAIWTVYNLMLFYFVQFGFIYAYNYFKKFQKQEKEKSALREMALRSEMNALKAQLNPHFLHNLFNSINASIPASQEHTRELIIQLSDLFRYQNYVSQQETVTIKEEIDFIEKYLGLMKVRLKERLNYKFEIPLELHLEKISPMLLQPLVENAVNHGISKKIDPSSLLIRMIQIDDKILVSIEDTGIGIFDKNLALTKGIGLSNTKIRLSKLYNSELVIE